MSATHIIFDGHLDLAMNAQEENHDLPQSVFATRAREVSQTNMYGRFPGQPQ